MGKFVRKVLLFGLLFLGVIWLGLLAIALSTNWTPRFEYKFFGHRTHWGSSLERVAEFEKWSRTNAQVPKGLILGSSTAYRNINPHILSEQTHINWFNYGSSNQSPQMSYYLLKQALRQTHLDVILLDVYGAIASNDGLEAAFDLIYNSELAASKKMDLLRHYSDVRLWLRFGYFYTKKIVPCNNYIVHDSTNGTYLKKGFVCSNQPALQHYDKVQKIQKMPDFTELQKIANLCKANGVKLILNISPSLDGDFRLPSSFKKYPLIQIKAFHNPQHFYDSHHMTCEGANLYSKRIIEKIQKLK
ncbi:MAG: hypothetical protein ACKOWX_08800 [Flavobacteriales bacterium]